MRSIQSNLLQRQQRRQHQHRLRHQQRRQQRMHLPRSAQQHSPFRPQQPRSTQQRRLLRLWLLLPPLRLPLL